MPEKGIFGTAWYPDHWPENEWERDLGRIRDAGISVVRFGEFSWSWFEPQCGKFDFAAYDRFVNLADKLGLKLVLCTPTATPPPWFDLKFPDGRMRNAHGERCLSARHFWCWNHAASRAQAEATIRALAGHFAGRAALWGWQIDNETNYAEEVHHSAPERMYDFHPEARAAFVAWLRARYASLEELNAAWWSNFWSQRYGTWEEVAIHRGRTNPHAWLDFMRWREANLAEFIGWQAGLLREITPDVRIGSNIPETGIPISLSIGQDYFAQAAGLDWVGTDLYAASGNRGDDMARFACSTDLMRSAAGDATFVIAEFQGGAHERAWPNGFAGETWDADYLEQAADVFSKHGVEQLWWFLWRPTRGGVEIGMNGVTALDGGESPRTKIVRHIADRADFPKARRKWEKRPLACIHYSRDSLRYQSFWPANLQALEDNMAGWHALLEALGYRVDFLSDEQLVENAPAGKPLLVCPFTLIAADEVVESLGQWKGALILGPQTAFCDGNGQLRDTRLPASLAARCGVVPGRWRDIGEMPTAQMLPAIPGYREVEILMKDARVAAKFRDRSPWLTSHRGTLYTAIDAGLAWWRANARQREAIEQKVRSALKTGDAA